MYSRRIPAPLSLSLEVHLHQEECEVFVCLSFLALETLSCLCASPSICRGRLPKTSKFDRLGATTCSLYRPTLSIVRTLFTSMA